MIATLLTDNPLFTRFWRSRLRRQQLVPLLVVFGLISLCIAGAGVQRPDPMAYSDPWEPAMAWLIVVQAFLLFIMAPAQVASAAAQARESGMLDFHRITPQTPARLTAGFLLGAPIREYLLYAATLLPYAVLATARPDHLPRALLVPVALLLLALLYNSLALLIGLSIPKGPQQRSAAILTVVVVILCNAAWMIPPLSYLAITPTAIGAIADSISDVDTPFLFAFLGRELSPTLLLVLHVLPLTAFLLIAAARKMTHEGVKPLPKPTALVCFLVIGLLTVGDSAVMFDTQVARNDGNASLIYGPSFVLYMLFIAGILLVAQSTPRAAEFLRGIRHARKAGQTAAPRWADEAANGSMALALSTSLFVLHVLALGVLYLYMEHASLVDIPYYTREDIIGAYVPYVLAALAMACTVGYFGVAQQYFLLTFRKHGLAYFAVLLFTLWALPILLGALALMIGMDDQQILMPIFSCTPLTAPAIIISMADHEQHWFIAWLSVSATIYPLLIFVPLYLRAVKKARFDALREPLVKMKEAV